MQTVWETGSRLITANVLITPAPARQMAEVASTEPQHRAAAAYHFAEADKAQAKGNQRAYAAHDSAGATHLAAADRPKGWVNSGDAYQVELAHIADADRLSEQARWHSVQAHKVEGAKVRRRRF